MTDKNNPDQLWLMLGEIRSDVKFLVAERGATNKRLELLEAANAKSSADTDKRLRALEGWKIRVGVLTGLLGVLVPTTVTVAAKKLGLL